jgi:hypothetical protein
MRTLAALALLTACATTSSSTTSQPTGGPRGLRATDHLDAAREHDEGARQAAMWPQSGGDRAAYSIPWVRSWDTAKEQERLAAIHRSKAAELQAAYDEACGSRQAEQIAVSPLARYGVGGWDTSTGVTLYLSADAGMPDQLLADLKCHRAWMMLAASGMDDCPLDLPGIKVDARGDKEGITVQIVVTDPALVDELHRRAAHELEAAHTH